MDPREIYFYKWAEQEDCLWINSQHVPKSFPKQLGWWREEGIEFPCWVYNKHNMPVRFTVTGAQYLLDCIVLFLSMGSMARSSRFCGWFMAWMNVEGSIWSCKAMEIVTALKPCGFQTASSSSIRLETQIKVPFPLLRKSSQWISYVAIPKVTNWQDIPCP